MTGARESLPVIFRLEGDTKEAVRPGKGRWTPVAFFPTLPGTRSPWTATCYAHTGQHGTCDVAYYRDTRPATEAEVANLLAELRRIYERDDDPEAVILRPVKRWTRHHDAARRAELERVAA